MCCCHGAVGDGLDRIGTANNSASIATHAARPPLEAWLGMQEGVACISVPTQEPVAAPCLMRLNATGVCMCWLAGWLAGTSAMVCTCRRRRRCCQATQARQDGPCTLWHSRSLLCPARPHAARVCGCARWHRGAGPSGSWGAARQLAVAVSNAHMRPHACEMCSVFPASQQAGFWRHVMSCGAAAAAAVLAGGAGLDARCTGRRGPLAQVLLASSHGWRAPRVRRTPLM
jgi:hypothetical protein